MAGSSPLRPQHGAATAQPAGHVVPTHLLYLRGVGVQPQGQAGARSHSSSLLREGTAGRGQRLAGGPRHAAAQQGRSPLPQGL